MSGDDRHRYDDIPHLPHPVSLKHPPMPTQARAAQFAPFPALTGYGEAIRETARLTQRCVALSDDALAALDAVIRRLAERLPEAPQAAIRYFVPDARKEGGTYATLRGRIRKIDAVARMLTLADGACIPMDDICSIREDPPQRNER